MKKIIALITLCFFLNVQVQATTIPAGTSVIIQPQQEIDADDVRTGDTLSFTVVYPIKENGNVLIKSGTEVLGQVTKKRNNFIFGIPGKLEVGNFKIVKENGETINFRGTIIDKAENRYWANIGWVFLFPLLLIKGDDGKIPMTLTYSLYTINDIEL